MRHKSDQNAQKCKARCDRGAAHESHHLREVGVPSRNIVHGRGVGWKSRIRVERIVGSSCAQSAREKYKLIRGTAKKALLKHLLVTGPGMRISIHMLDFKRSQEKVSCCSKILKPCSTVRSAGPQGASKKQPKCAEVQGTV